MKEIHQQPALWEKVLRIYRDRKDEINGFIHDIIEKNGEVRVIFTGAGTSEYVGNVVAADLMDRDGLRFESVATTDLVSCPKDHFDDRAVLLVSFARSGNSPESLAAVELAEKLAGTCYHLAITCAKEGKLAERLKEQDNAKVVIMPEGSNDEGFAMTSSFTCMLLTALLVFDDRDDREDYIPKLVDAGKKILDDTDAIEKIADFDFDRIVYLGSGSLYQLTNECRLKILELTAGAVTTLYESSMGFRHGPKSYVNNNTFIVSLLSNDDYTVEYDEDILEEVYHDGEAKKILAVTTEKTEAPWEEYVVDGAGLPDVYLAAADVIIAQLIAVVTSLRVGNTPDTPSKKGTVNRVVKGVTIHEFK